MPQVSTQAGAKSTDLAGLIGAECPMTPRAVLFRYSPVLQSGDNFSVCINDMFVHHPHDPYHSSGWIRELLTPTL